MNQIGNFQFTNLVKNKVPFILISNKEKWSEQYDKPDVEYILKSSIFISAENIKEQNYLQLIDSINESQYKNLAPIVIACDTSELSESIYNFLSDHQFTNCYLYIADQLS